jgi:flagellar FliL protein
MADAVADEEAPKKKLPIVRILITVLAAILLIAVGAGATFLYMKLTKPAEENPLAIVIERKAAPAEAHGDEHAAEPAAAGDKGGHGGGHGAPAAPAGPQGKPVPTKETFVTSYFEFPGNFTTNLKGSRRFVQMSIGLATQYDKKVIENVQKHEVAIRAEVLALLAEQAEPDVIGVDNRRRLQGLIRDSINRILMERTNFGGIDDVYITALVMQ